MTSFKRKPNRTRIAIHTAIGVAIALTAPLAQADITGNIGVVSKYVLRGITNSAENNGAATQGGFDWSHPSGIYAGYWGSNLSYGNTTTTTGFENDLYAGYKLKAGPVGLNFGAIHYAYTQVADADATEALVAASIGPATFGVKYLLDNVVWGNKGDMYWTLDVAQALPSDFTLAGTLGYYVYDKSDPGTAGTIPAGTTKTSSAFRHVNLTLSHPIINKTTTMGVTYIVGGKDRTETKQHDAVVLSLSTTF